MQLLSFDVLRTMEMPGVRHIKPEDWFRSRDQISRADWVLFPEYWQVNALVYGWKTRVFPSVSTYHLGHDKVEMTRAFQAICPSHVPHTLILPATAAGIEQVLDEFAMPFVAKEVRSSMGNGVYLIEQRSQFLDYARKNSVLYVQEHLPIHRDIRVVWVGRTCVAAYWRQAAQGSFHNNVARGGEVSFDDVPAAATELVAKVASALGVDHAGFDIAAVDGHCFLLEFNLRFGTQALNTRGLRIGNYILEYLRSQTPGTMPRPETPGFASA